MKKIFFSILTLFLLLSGCARSETAELADEEISDESLVQSHAERLISQMTLTDKLWQMLYLSRSDVAKNETAAKKAGGVILFGDDIASASQVKELNESLSEGMDIAPFIGVDEEGGDVSRLGKKGIIPDAGFMNSIGKTGDVSKAAQVGEMLSRELKALGFNMDFAPVTDTLSNPANKEIGRRAFSSDPVLTGEMAAAEIKALQEGGLSACAKHFPGHGSTSANSHEGTSVSALTRDELEAGDMKAFEAAVEADVDFIMVSHMSLPKINGGNIPSSLSETVVSNMLKKELNYGGIVITDALNMGAVSKNYTSGEAAVMAVKAGADMLLMPDDTSEALAALKEAVESGSISEERIDESVMRILKIKEKRGLI